MHILNLTENKPQKEKKKPQKEYATDCFKKFFENSILIKNKNSLKDFKSDIFKVNK